MLGNIAKSGSVSFAATYNATTNHFTNYGVTYDPMGDTSRDNLGNWFTCDSERRQVAVASTFDAFNRPVEIHTGTSSHMRVIYTPTGQKFAQMKTNGARVQEYFVRPRIASSDSCLEPRNCVFQLQKVSIVLWDNAPPRYWQRPFFTADLAALLLI